MGTFIKKINQKLPPECRVIYFPLAQFVKFPGSEKILINWSNLEIFVVWLVHTKLNKFAK